MTTETRTTPADLESFRPRRRLSSKILLLTILFVMIAEVLIFVPSVANFRMTWLSGRMSTAAAASVLIASDASLELPPSVQDEVLMATGAKAIALHVGEDSRFIRLSETVPPIHAHVNVGEFSAFAAIRDAFDTLLFGGDRFIRVYGPIADSDNMIELILPDAPLRAAMLVYARNVALLSLVISLITASLVFMAINRIAIRPIRRMTESMLAFSRSPDNPDAIVRPSGRDDELGIAERELAAMQGRLHETLKEQKRLADLGLAVSKINHDMRNILASAQLMSDRLSGVTDPSVQRFAPKLMRTLGRAINYTENVLSYGRAGEAAPTRRRIKLSPVVADVEELLGIDPASGIEFSANIPDDFELDADSEQLFRVLMNLCRNSVEAMRGDDDPATVKRLTVSAARMGTTALISVEDTGPGLPKKARENLFSAFKGSARAGGTGLGLAIAHELVRAHGGTLELRDDREIGTHFEIRLPDAPVSLEQERARRGAGRRSSGSA
ncbi:sensor histidine kinase [Oricola thermophila]|uniref:histidine kinase n=1 Tax=Oricola thermophila TaxID=2742145 RepID=A0A6N1VEM5_9HYPH|nr:HAMP domain-containing sensor histidine kinase [Oricola thermophila]QKV19406.1 HAMP domain-containing histidine kinase [Oricola thermophila]